MARYNFEELLTNTDTKTNNFLVYDIISELNTSRHLEKGMYIYFSFKGNDIILIATLGLQKKHT